MVRMKRRVVVGNSKEDETAAVAGDSKDDKADSSRERQGE